MKKQLMQCLCGATVLLILSGCTSVESTQKFNGMGLSDREDKAVCHTFVEIPCFTFWGLPIIGGSASGSGKVALFQDNTDVESAIHLLTSEIRSKNGARVINAQTFLSERSVLLGIFTKRVMQASGTGVRTRSEAGERAMQQFDQEPVPSY
ncbi:MAG: hypothetical protein LBM70_02905 [Victivallales bacterium]|jgi:hypothetical protein|nr:hypothetical protein [Victivallales bacterium]